MPDSQSRFVDHWDRLAPSYDRKSAWLEQRFLRAGRTWACARAHGETLELAVGTGANLAHFPDGVRLTGVDWSAAMLDVARQEAQRLDRQVDLRRADAADLPFADASFDTVISTFSMCCIPDPAAALAEAVRALRPGGTLLLADHVVSSNWAIRAAQHALELVTVPLQGEHLTRRSLPLLAGLPVEIEETERGSRGVIELVRARRLSG